MKNFKAIAKKLIEFDKTERAREIKALCVVLDAIAIKEVEL